MTKIIHWRAVGQFNF